MIFCFSGTGNSRYIAERLAAALQDSMINLNSKIKTHLVTTEKLNAVTGMIRSGFYNHLHFYNYNDLLLQMKGYLRRANRIPMKILG